MQHVFGNIDKTKVTTGYLKEFGIRFNEVEAYNGAISATNLADKTQWQNLPFRKKIKKKLTNMTKVIQPFRNKPYFWCTI